jgi:hypothetical protein
LKCQPILVAFCPAESHSANLPHSPVHNPAHCDTNALKRFLERQALVLTLHLFWDFGPKVQQFT